MPNRKIGNREIISFKGRYCSLCNENNIPVALKIEVKIEEDTSHPPSLVNHELVSIIGSK